MRAVVEKSFCNVWLVAMKGAATIVGSLRLGKPSEIKSTTKPGTHLHIFSMPPGIPEMTSKDEGELLLMIFWANLIFPGPVAVGAVGSAPVPGRTEQTTQSRC